MAEVEAFEYQKAGMRMQIILLKKMYFGKHFIDIKNENSWIFKMTFHVLSAFAN